MLPLRENGSSVSVEPTIDLQMIQSWRRACRDTHGACCNDNYATALAQHIDHLILVDVTSGSLTTLSTSSPIVYAALSYVWGDVPMFKTRKSNIEVLLQPGALYDKANGIVLPDTVRDAMHLVEALGERYLWVDCLCVVQDAGSENIDITLRAMAHIYASADFTIVAADGKDAGYGLRGVGGPSTNRIPSSIWYSHRGSAYPEDSKWASRGWTFQESLFSRRLLIFRATVSWMCGRCEWREGVDVVKSTKDIQESEDVDWPAERPHLGVPMGMMSLVPTVPSLGRWGMLVENYSSRTLTYDKDARAAFAGATEIMGATFPGGLLHGLPRFFFDIALLWLPKGNLLRRQEEPSWSWTGWKDGVIDCLSAWYPFYATLFRDTDHPSTWVSIATLKPVAEYRMANALNEIDAEFNGFYRYQALGKRPNEILPDGWKRHDHPDGAYFTNTYSQQKTRYPFPLPIMNPAERLHVPSSPVLRCRAPCAELTVGHPITCSKTHRTMMTLCSGRHEMGNLVPMSDITDYQPPYGSVCELVAISEAET